MSGWDAYWKAQQADIAYRREEERIEREEERIEREEERIERKEERIERKEEERIEREEERIERRDKHFRCPPMPPKLAAEARRLGRLDHVTESGERVSREWYFDNLARWRAANPLTSD